MRVVSLNLDHGDAAVVGRAIRLALDSCRCADRPDQALCPDCKALAAALKELSRLVQRPAQGRAPLLTLVAANGEPRPPVIAPLADERAGGGTGFRLLAGDGGARSTR